MKKIILLPFILICCSLICSSQAPQAFKYQAVIRDTTGSVIADQLVSIRISIIKGEINGEIAYIEIHDVTTNALGLVNLEIGKGLPVQGEFAKIPWGEDSFYIKLEIDMEGAMNYQLLGTSQLLAVPYALYAETSGSGSTPDTVISQWKDTDDGIYYDEGNVGIGTSVPVSNLQIEGTSVNTSNRRFLQLRNNSTDGLSAVVFWMNAGEGNSSTFLSHHAASYNLYGGKYAETSHLWNDGQGIFFRTRPESKFVFETYDGGQYSDPIEIMRLTGDGKIGLGTENPDAEIHIERTSHGAEGRRFILLKNNSTDELANVFIKMIAGDGSTTADLTHHSETYSSGDIYGGTTCLWNNGYGLILRTTPVGRISFETIDPELKSVKEYMRMTGDGKFGVGILSPQRTLHVKDVMRLEPRSTPPDNPAEGDIYMDGSDHHLKVYDGAIWQSCW